MNIPQVKIDVSLLAIHRKYRHRGSDPLDVPAGLRRAGLLLLAIYLTQKLILDVKFSWMWVAYDACLLLTVYFTGSKPPREISAK